MTHCFQWIYMHTLQRDANVLIEKLQKDRLDIREESYVNDDQVVQPRL